MTHLIVTRLKEFWPNQAPAVMMAPWCLPAFGDDQGDDIHQGRMLPCPWSSSSEIEQVYTFAQETYLAFLPKLCCALNKVHGTSYSDRYWQILVGPWLCRFVHVIYDRFTRLELARDHYSDLKLIGLDSHSFMTPVNTVDFTARVVSDDLYNLQLITRLAENMGINIESFREPESKPTLTTGGDQPGDQLRSAKRRAYEYIQNKLFPHANIMMYLSYHPQYFLAKLFILSRGKIVDRQPSCATLPPINPDITKRNNLKSALLDGDLSTIPTPLQSTLVEMVAKELPLVFLEGYLQLETLTVNEFGSHSPKAICSATGWYFDEPFKCWAAKAAGQGTKLFGMQHGGNYGIGSHESCEDHEVAITDGYLTWGWSEGQSKKSVLPTPAQKLLDIKRRNSISKEHNEILFGGTFICAYLLRFPYITEWFQNCFEWQKRFFTAVDKKTLSLLRVRLYRENNTWEIRKCLEHNFPTLTFEGWDRSFRESLSDCRLYVCDHLSTTYAEALASNIPTVIFWNPEVNQMRSEAQPFFDDLRRVGILHDTPESAAAWVEKVYPDVSRWWNSQECRQVVDNFCRNYARGSRFPLLEWLGILNKIVRI